MKIYNESGGGKYKNWNEMVWAALWKMTMKAVGVGMKIGMKVVWIIMKHKKNCNEIVR